MLYHRDNPLKALPVMLLAAALPVLLYLHRPAPVEIHPDQPILPGRTNPPLHQINATTFLDVGARLWFKTNRTPFARVISTADDHAFARHTGSAVLVRDFNQEFWISRPALNGSWTDR
jgi:hypothetical protein